MRLLFLFFLLVNIGFANTINSSIIRVDLKKDVATIKADGLKVGMSGFISHLLTPNHSMILADAKVIQIDSTADTATLKLSAYTELKSNSLPKGKWVVSVGDTAILGVSYARGLLIAPNADAYYNITSSMKNIEWIHPDIFTSILSYNGHPTPLRQDFKEFSDKMAVGLIYFYIDKKLYIVDANSFKTLSTQKLKSINSKIDLPFYTRIKKIDANWFGAGNDKLKTYAPYYLKLLKTYNK